MLLIGNLRGGGSSGGSGSIDVDGNGLVVANNGAYYGRSLNRFGAVQAMNPDGINGEIKIGSPPSPLLAYCPSVDGNVTTDTVITLGQSEHDPDVYGRFDVDTYLIDEIVVWQPSGTVASTLAAGFYTQPGKSGVTVWPATQGYTGLNAAPNVVRLKFGTASGEQPSLGPLRVPFLYWSPSTVNGAALTMRVAVFGRVLQQIAIP